jgi:hypothetical protein
MSVNFTIFCSITDYCRQTDPADIFSGQSFGNHKVNGCVNPIALNHPYAPRPSSCSDQWQIIPPFRDYYSGVDPVDCRVRQRRKQRSDPNRHRQKTDEHQNAQSSGRESRAGQHHAGWQNRADQLGRMGSQPNQRIRFWRIRWSFTNAICSGCTVPSLSCCDAQQLPYPNKQRHKVRRYHRAAGKKSWPKQQPGWLLRKTQRWCLRWRA